MNHGSPRQIAILHRAKSPHLNVSSLGGALWALDESRWVKWETCLRQVYFGVVKDIPEGIPDDVEIYTGEEAYLFCMTTVCGLKSPMVGETEVWGQFRSLFREFDYAKLQQGLVLQKFVESIFTDAKAVRAKSLTGLGSQSYGSLARRVLRGIDEINILGSGLLVKDMLPWLVKGASKVRIICRDVEKGRQRVAELKIGAEQVEVCSLEDTMSEGAVVFTGALIVAAPLEAKKIQRQISQSGIEKVVDLRDNSAEDRVQMNCDVIALNDFFGEIETTRRLVTRRVTEAERDIRSRMEKRFNQIQVRPFGWEDLCL